MVARVVSPRVVRAAGGVVWRSAPEPTVPDPRVTPSDGARPGRLVAVIHRPKYDDWTLPKGKLDPGESDEDAAVREVEEETAQRAEILRDLGEISYRTTRGGITYDKVVRYFEMRVPDPVPFEPHAEVDEVRWMPPTEALELLTYDRDVEVLRRYDPSLPASR